MSKQSKAKEQQGYVPKAKPRTCVNCVNFKCETVHYPARNSWCGPYDKQTNLRCTLGGFKVMKMGTCNEWSNESALAQPERNQTPTP